MLDPGELGALRSTPTCSSTSLDGDETRLEAQLTEAEVTALGDGINQVVPTGFVLGGGVDGDEVRVELAEGCVSMEIEASDPDVEDLDLDVCSGDELADSLPGELGDAFEDVEVPDELSELIEAFEPVAFGVITVERDGEHFVSPVRTLFDLLAVSFRGLEARTSRTAASCSRRSRAASTTSSRRSSTTSARSWTTSSSRRRSLIEDDDDVSVPDVPLRTPTGPAGSGPAGELLVGDVVAGTFPAGGEASFTLIGTAGDAFIGAQATDGGDLTITLTDVATGEELDFSDDFVGFDPEGFAVLAEGQPVLVTIRAFSPSDSGEFVVYYEN